MAGRAVKSRAAEGEGTRDPSGPLRPEAEATPSGAQSIAATRSERSPSETNQRRPSGTRIRKVEVVAAIDPRLSPVIDRLVELLLADLLRRRSKQG